MQGPFLVLARGAFFFAVGVEERAPAGQHDGDLVDAHGLDLLDEERLGVGVGVGEVAGEVDEESYLRVAQVTGQERLLRDRHRPQAPRHADLARHRTAGLLGACRDPPGPGLGAIGGPRDPRVPHAEQRDPTGSEPVPLRVQVHQQLRQRGVGQLARTHPRQRIRRRTHGSQDTRHPRARRRQGLVGVVAIDHAFESNHRYRSIATPWPKKYQQPRQRSHDRATMARVAAGSPPPRKPRGSADGWRAVLSEPSRARLHGAGGVAIPCLPGDGLLPRSVRLGRGSAPAHCPRSALRWRCHRSVLRGVTDGQCRRVCR